MKKFVSIKGILFILLALALTGCSGGGGGTASTDPNFTTVLKGVFADAPVNGVDYKTATQSGVTSGGGSFNYVAGETVTFSIGNTTLGSKAAKAVITPVDLVSGATNETDPTVVKMVQLILSLADNKTAANLTIGATKRNAMKTAADFDFTKSQTLFEADIQNVAGQSVVTSTKAKNHFAATLAKLGTSAGGTKNVTVTTTTVTTQTVNPMVWQRLVRDLKAAKAVGMPDDTVLRQVNGFFNQIPYFSDIKHWGVNDYWATPVEMIGSFGGDCEDYFIGKYLSIKDIGIPVSKLRITYVRAVELGEPHMVLAYYPTPDADPLILDNLINDIRPASQRTDLEPVYGFNDDDLWVTGIAANKGGGRQWRDLLEKLVVSRVDIQR